MTSIKLPPYLTRLQHLAAFAQAKAVGPRHGLPYNELIPCLPFDDGELFEEAAAKTLPEKWTDIQQEHFDPRCDYRLPEHSFPARILPNGGYLVINPNVRAMSGYKVLLLSKEEGRIIVRRLMGRKVGGIPSKRPYCFGSASEAEEMLWGTVSTGGPGAEWHDVGRAAITT